MQYRRRIETVDAIKVNGLHGTNIPDGSWLVTGPNGIATVMTDQEFSVHFEPVTGEETINRRGRTLDVAPPHANWRGKTIPDRVLSVVGATPMNAAMIAELVKTPTTRVRTVLSRMAKNGILTTKRGSGLYSLGRAAR